MGRVKLSPAIIGTGQSVKDLVDKDALLKNRWCIGLNEAMEYPWQCACIHHKFTELVHPDTEHLVVSEFWPLRAQDHVPPGVWTLIYRIPMHTYALPPAGKLFGAVSRSAQFLIQHGWREIELYGIDLDDELHGQHVGELEGLASEHGVTFINCCPSTKLKAFKTEERPWTRSQPSLDRDRALKTSTTSTPSRKHAIP